MQRQAECQRFHSDPQGAGARGRESAQLRQQQRRLVQQQHNNTQQQQRGQGERHHAGGQGAAPLQ